MTPRPAPVATERCTPGRAAYEADVAARPQYHDGSARKTWEQLDDVAQWSWERNPTPRAWIGIDAIGFALIMAAFFGWYIVLCPPASAATAPVGDAAALTLVTSILATLFGVALTVGGVALLVIAAVRALYRNRTRYDEHGLPRHRDLSRERRP
ncbi:hypothetical protein CHELA1G11_12893 [Hyphomicrobiales bacterium]|nr:hypothetical protein CHELA1G2_11417 [Hyphomicrobiales bacterium]CAH1667857.1 hypothetical protein CHELA1G11_12893 [Hyphomicrobiales bacterium]